MNWRSAQCLDGKTRGRNIRIPLAKAKPKDGYIKLSFVYSGAATLDRCIDSWWCASVDGTRSRSGGALAEVVRQEVRSPVAAADSVASACAEAESHAGLKDRIVVFGSFHTVGPALDWLESRGLLPAAARPEYTSP